MSLTCDLNELVRKRIARDPAFGTALLREGIGTMLAGDVDTGKALLRDCIKATVGFEKLGEATGTLRRQALNRSSPQLRWSSARGLPMAPGDSRRPSRGC